MSNGVAILLDTVNPVLRLDNQSTPGVVSAQDVESCEVNHCLVTVEFHEIDPRHAMPNDLVRE